MLSFLLVVQVVLMFSKENLVNIALLLCQCSDCICEIFKLTLKTCTPSFTYKQNSSI